MKLKHLYCYFKKWFGSGDEKDHWDNNPFVIL
jgi:hypothetical protein